LNFNYRDYPPTPGTSRIFKKGERVAQLVVYKVATMGEISMEETNSVTETNRGKAGFGSSGL
jgi:dUTPase